MEQNNFFWKILNGELPLPKAARLLGMEVVEVDPEAGTLRTTFQAKSEFTNPAGHVQGGFLAAMLDETVGPALLATLGPNQIAVTLELSTQFIAPALPGKITGSGRITGRGGKIAFVDGELYQEERLVARATGTMIIRELG